MRRYPWLRQACATIANDSGAINRFSTEEQEVDEMMARVTSMGYNTAALMWANYWLLYIPGDDLDLDSPWYRVCSPADDDLDPVVPWVVSRVLNEAFGG